MRLRLRRRVPAATASTDALAVLRAYLAELREVASDSRERLASIELRLEGDIDGRQPGG